MAPTATHGGPAFPVIGAPGAPEDYPGMTLRDYFAAKAMQGRLAGCLNADGDSSHLEAAIAYQIADAMLKAREP